MERREMPHDLILGRCGLMDTVCHCGRPKGSKMSFCVGCYAKLPRATQLALYRRVGFGYERAHEESMEILRESGRVPKTANDKRESLTTSPETKTDA